MSRFPRRGGILGAWLLVVAVALFVVQRHEQTLEQGQLALLRLAPVDPRSLMQGDYMALRFAADNQLAQRLRGTEAAASPVPRLAHFMLDSEGRATLDGLGNTPRAAPGQISMRIRMAHGARSVGPNAFFFQEGTGELYEAAQWGGFRVADDGTALLVSLHDAELHVIGAQRR